MREVGLGDTSLSLSAYAGEIVHLGGGSPMARLRVLAMAAGFGPGGSGRCEVLGQDFQAVSETQRRAWRERHVARVLACDHLHEAASVLAAVALPLVRQGVPLADARARAELELDALGAGHLAAARPDALPRPDARLVLLARALVMRPRLLVLEQPETDLPPAAVSSVRLALWALSSAFGTCVLMSTSHPRLLASADRFVDLDREGDPERDREQRGRSAGRTVTSRI
jgi:putative ABC transport system ATP-binding protein